MRDNLTITRWRAINMLKNNRDIVIKPAVKGVSIVIMDKQHVLEPKRQLNNDTHYTKLDHPL